MTSKTVTIWRCDFCHKQRIRKSAMVLHERRCTMNPNRECGMCKQGKRSPQPLAYLKLVATNDVAGMAAFNDDDPQDIKAATPEDVVSSILDAADGCPACALAAIRQSGTNRSTETQSPLPFEYVSEVKKFWEQVNEDDARNDMMSVLY